MSTPSPSEPPPSAPVVVTAFSLPGWDARLRGFRCGDEVDTFALVTDRYLIFVDTTATPEQAAAIVEMLRAEAQERQPLVILSHADYDHCWGSAVFAPGALLPAPIIGHALTRERLLSQDAADELAEKQREDARFAAVRLVAPDIAYIERLVVDGGDLALELLHTPGHTPDHTVLWVPALRLLLAGDAVEHPWPYVHRASDMPIIRATLARLAALRPASIAVCHGSVSDSALIARNIAYFDAVERHCREALTRAPALSQQINMDGEALERAVSLPYAEALRMAESPPDETLAFYRAFHQSAIRSMLEWLSAGSGSA